MSICYNEWNASGGGYQGSHTLRENSSEMGRPFCCGPKLPVPQPTQDGVNRLCTVRLGNIISESCAQPGKPPMLMPTQLGLIPMHAPGMMMSISSLRRHDAASDGDDVWSRGAQEGRS